MATRSSLRALPASTRCCARRAACWRAIARRWSPTRCAPRCDDARQALRAGAPSPRRRRRCSPPPRRAWRRSRRRRCARWSTPRASCCTPISAAPLLADAAVEALTAVAAQPCSARARSRRRRPRRARRARRSASLRAHRRRGGDGGEQQRRRRCCWRSTRWPRGARSIVSRGELVEIGGSFRIPEVLRQERRGAARGRHDQPHAPRDDYERAIGERTALLLKVHPSNYRIDGFTAAVELDELVALGRAARRAGDGGSRQRRAGRSVALRPAARAGGRRARRARRRPRHASAATSCSAARRPGIVVGARRADRAHAPAIRCARALRCDKLTLAALEATLRLYRTAPDLAAVLPTLRWLTRPLAEIDDGRRGRASTLLARALGAELRDRARSTPTPRSAAAPSRPRRCRSKAIAITHPHRVAARHRRALPRQRAADHRPRARRSASCSTCAAS